jgi:hypothetical protein
LKWRSPFLAEPLEVNISRGFFLLEYLIPFGSSSSSEELELKKSSKWRS